VSLTRAAEDVGVNIKAMRAILVWAGIPLRQGRLGHKPGPRVHPRFMVDWDEARDAADRWFACESIREASNRTRVPVVLLALALRLADVRKASEKHGKARLCPGEVDRVIRTPELMNRARRLLADAQKNLRLTRRNAAGRGSDRRKGHRPTTRKAA
jgi:hypothetical protein